MVEIYNYGQQYKGPGLPEKILKKKSGSPERNKKMKSKMNNRVDHANQVSALRHPAAWFQRSDSCFNTGCAMRTLYGL